MANSHDFFMMFFCYFPFLIFSRDYDSNCNYNYNYDCYFN